MSGLVRGHSWIFPHIGLAHMDSGPRQIGNQGIHPDDTPRNTETASYCMMGLKSPSLDWHSRKFYCCSLPMFDV